MTRSPGLQFRSDNRLFWSPPTLVNPDVYVLTNDPASRKLTGGATKDAVLVFGEVLTSNLRADPDACMVQVDGFRSVTVIGGHMKISPGPKTTVSTLMNNGDTTLTVASTSGFPTSGGLRVDGEGMLYTGITATTFTGITRNHGFFNSGATSSNTTHAVGANVYQGEAYRSGFEFNDCAGTVHVEGIRMEGDLNDAFRFSGQIPLVQMQNITVDPVHAWDRGYDTDGHPDAVQFYDGGAVEARLGRVTLKAEEGGRCILNAGNDTGAAAVGKIVLRDTELIRAHPNAIELLTNSTGATVWDVQNSFFRYDGLPVGARGSTTTDTTLIKQFSNARYTIPSGRFHDMVPRHTVGLVYGSPGYVA